MQVMLTVTEHPAVRELEVDLHGHGLRAMEMEGGILIEIFRGRSEWMSH